ncbi:MAG: peptidylprolyl isomerase, partial [Flavobacteriales bacterium]
LRSEFSAMKYREGTIGKASVGKDTEGVQWFITHSATPHLEWGYTCFGQVAEGMEVVRSIQIGDEIIGIEFP